MKAKVTASAAVFLLSCTTALAGERTSFVLQGAAGVPSAQPPSACTAYMSTVRALWREGYTDFVVSPSGRQVRIEAVQPDGTPGVVVLRCDDDGRPCALVRMTIAVRDAAGD